ncbi:uncharacterized protein TNIN_250701 [Trichonephila inaurata madagascariensis]|uniref:Uncharacterized protein n=1 Tax=Trichonephila inaurata madagascariensis TaxID=2747483 RepID=A0A8X7CHI8_9ARAC|nr:uncharacterized protein TNIN_250701 [Trichonephila inaurata madagascariensis]
MTIKFWPTLQLVACVRIAQGIIYSFDLEHLKRSLLGGLQNTEYIEPITKKILEIVLPAYCARFSHLTAARKNTEEVKIVPLPPQVKKKLGGIIFSLGLEIKLWYECHRFIEHKFNLDLRNKLSWFSFGVIDRLETARNFIQDEAFDIGVRFHLACKYCLDDDVQMLWRKMSIADRINAMRRIPRTRSIDLYIQSLRRKRPRNWTEISRNERHKFFLGNCLGIRSYFTKLRFPVVRYHCILIALGSGMAHQYDLYSCISLLNAAELNSMLSRFPTPELCEIFKTFLRWPFQIMFLDLVHNFQQHINKDIFYCVVTFILNYKLGMGFEDHMYIEIFERFWNLFSAKYEDSFKKDVALSALAKYVLESSKDYDARQYRYLVNLYFPD